mgnify:CR=1 FL=1
MKKRERQLAKKIMMSSNLEAYIRFLNEVAQQKIA